jgi:hypothetical protein
MFTRLYIETSVLVEAGWPRLSADLENVLKITTFAKILPAGVEIELQHRWQRDLEEKISAVKSRIRAVEVHFGGVQRTSVTAEVPDLAQALDAYLKAVDALKQKYGLSTGRFTTRPVPEIFTMAATRHPPFKPGKEDVGFRDAVIFLSVVDDLTAAKGHVGALVARDDAFHDPRIVEFAAGAGAELQVFRSVKDVFDSLIRDAVAYVKEQWNATTTQVLHTLTSRLAGIEKFIAETLEIPEWNLVSGARVVAVPRIEALAVRNVRVPNPLDARGLERVRLSFDVQVKFHAKIQRFDLPQAQRVKIGPEKTLLEVIAALGPIASLASAAPGSSAPLFGSQTDEIEVDRVVRVEASADPKFQTFEFESATLVMEGLGGMTVGL